MLRARAFERGAVLHAAEHVGEIGVRFFRVCDGVGRDARHMQLARQLDQALIELRIVFG